MFQGPNQVNIDAKGRLAIPTRYRDQLIELCQGHLTATVSMFDKCLLLYPRPEWEEVQRKLKLLPTTDRQAREIQRYMLGYATDMQMDSNGRMLLPALLREFAELGKKVVLLDLGNKFEIWNDDLGPRLNKVVEENEKSEPSDAVKNVAF